MNYVNHVIINFALALICLFFYQQSPFLTNSQLGALIFSYFIGTTILSPDIDIRNSEPIQRCGFICKPYAMMSNHRGRTHQWWGFILIIFYLVIVFSIIILLIKSSLLTVFYQKLILYKIEVLFGMFGLFLANLFHIVVDKLT